jgi:hypothetical protein
MIQKKILWILPLALGVMLFALRNANTCNAQQPPPPEVNPDDQGDWDAPPPGPRDKDLPPVVKRRPPGRRMEGPPREGIVPPPERKREGRPHGAPAGEMGPMDRGGGPADRPRGGPQPYGLPPREEGARGYGGRGYGGYGGPRHFRPEEQDPEMFELGQKEHELEMKVGRLLEEFRRAEGEKKEEIKGVLRETVSQQFELRQQRRRLELKRLEEGLKHMRDVIERRDKARDQIINRHISELLGVEDELRF